MSRSPSLWGVRQTRNDGERERYGDDWGAGTSRMSNQKRTALVVNGSVAHDLAISRSPEAGWARDRHGGVMGSTSQPIQPYCEDKAGQIVPSQCTYRNAVMVIARRKPHVRLTQSSHVVGHVDTDIPSLLEAYYIRTPLTCPRCSLHTWDAVRPDIRYIKKDSGHVNSFPSYSSNYSTGS